jgi:(p)ppGpp synthase/HD superfamily hydrolase
VTAYAQTNIALYEELRRAGRGGDLAPAAAAYVLAARLFAGRYRRSGKPFVCHLVGTASILAAHGAEGSVVCAGLLHSAYTHGDFGDGREPGEVVPPRRDVVRRALGEAGEELVHGYATTKDRAKTWIRAPEAVAGLSPRERALVTIRLANLLDDCLDCGAIYAGEHKHRDVLRRLDAGVPLAAGLGHARLAEELRRASSALREPHPGPIGEPPAKGRYR